MSNNNTWTVVTYRDYDFTDKDGRAVKGRNLFCVRETSEPSWAGLEFAKFGISCNVPAYDFIPVCGDSYELAFNRYGRVVDLVPCNL